VLNINIADSPIRNIKNVLEGGLVLQKNGDFRNQLEVSPIVPLETV